MSKENYVYFTALKTKQLLEQPKKGLSKVEIDDSVAFQHDLVLQELPKEYSKCTAYYTDIAWKQGFLKYQKRANVIFDYSWQDYLQAIHKACSVTRAIIVGGSSASKFLKSRRQEPTKLNGKNAVAFIYGDFDYEISFTNSESILDLLAINETCLGDFCCGNGLTGIKSKSVGNSFVLSDINSKCIRYIAEYWRNQDAKVRTWD